MYDEALGMYEFETSCTVLYRTVSYMIYDTPGTP